MARHGWDRERHGPPPRRGAAQITMILGGLFFGALCLTFGLYLLLVPEQCDSSSMGAEQRCQSYGRSSESLIDPPAATDIDAQSTSDALSYATGRNLDGQVTKNRLWGAVAAGFGLLLGGTYAVFAFGALRDWWARRHHGPKTAG